MFEDRAGRTERPTPKKLNEARKDGQVARSKELPGALALFAFLMFAHLGGSAWIARLERLLVDTFSGLNRPDLTPDHAVVLLSGVGLATAQLLAVPLGAMVVAGLGGNLIQGVPPLTLKPLQPKLSKLNPIKGLGKIFKLKAWVELLKGLLKMLLYTAIAVSAVRQSFEDGLPGAPGPDGAYLALMTLCGRVVLRVALFALALALIDFMYQRFQHMRDLRMTKQEIKDEQKQLDGDPMVKARIRSKQMAMARSRMMADVPKATLVVTNPTHYAVALRYVPGEMDVPQVLAKGKAKLAAKIRQVAEEHSVPVISDPPLARALYRSVEVGATVPAKLFRAVAEVLALVLRNRGGGRG